MTALSEMRPGSFRGVPFMVPIEAEDETGRRVEIHRYPQRDDAYPEDLGRKSEPFTIEAMTLGADYLTRADSLYRACGEQGPADLVHPWLGTRRVLCLSCKRKFSTKEGGSARFSLTFILAGDNRYPAPLSDTRIPVRDAATTARTAAIDDFARRFSTLRRPSFVGDAAVKLIGSVADWLGGGAPRLAPSGSLLPGFNQELGQFRDDATGLIGSPSLLGGRLVDLFVSVGSLFSSARSAVFGYRSLAGWDTTLDFVPTPTSNRVQQAENQAAFASLARRAALIEEARNTADVDFEHYDEAVSWRNDLADRLDQEMIVAGDAGDDPTYRALESLRAASVRDITARGADLSRLVHITSPQTRPALSLAWQLYGDDPDAVSTRADEIARRNRLAHPGFVPGGRDIEVIADG
jgi:prophage DNA circulation protein